MSSASYPNYELLSTSQVLDDTFNGSVIVSNLSGTATLTITASMAANFTCQVVQNAAGAVAVAAGTGATVNGVGGATKTSGQYAVMRILGTSIGNAVITGSIA